jgi:hypothetical protein
MEVSGALLERVASSMTRGSPEEQQQAADFLNAWQNSPDSLVISHHFLSPDVSPPAQYFAAVIVSHLVAQNWFSYDRSVRVEIRDHLFEYAFGEDSGMQTLTDQLSVIVGMIAFHEWPDAWPEFVVQLMSVFENGSDSARIRVCRILGKFVHQVNSSLHITVTRRAQTISAFLDALPDQFLFFVPEGELAAAVLEFAVDFSLLIASEGELAERYANWLLNTFVVQDRFASRAIVALRNLLSQTRFLTTLIDPLLSLIAERGCLLVELHEFICDMLHHAVPVFPGICQNSGSASSVLELLRATLVHHPRGTFLELFWLLWSKVLQIEYAQFVAALFEQIIGNFFELLCDAHWLSRLLSPFTRAAVRALFELVPDLVLGFLERQPPSHSLCVMIGIIQDERLLGRVHELGNFCGDGSPLPVVSSVLFCVSRNLAVMRDTPDLLHIFEQLTSAFLFHDPDFQTSVLLALNHAATRVPRTLLSNDGSFAGFLFDGADPSRFSRPNFSRLCRILAKLACASSPPLREGLNARLAGLPLAFLASRDLAEVELGTDIAWAIASLSICGSNYVVQCLWQPLLAAMATTREYELFAAVVAVFPATVRASRWGQCFRSCMGFVETVQSVIGHDAAIVDAFTQLVQCHIELADTRGKIEAFAHRLAEETPPCFFEFFAVCGLRSDEEDVVIPAACGALRSLDHSISLAAAALLKTVVIKKKDVAFFERWRPGIICAVFEALLDRSHVGLVKPIGKVVFALYRKPLTADHIEELVAAAVAGVIDDPGMAATFAYALTVAAQQSRDTFLQMIRDLMLNSGRADPSEMLMFINRMETTALARDVLGTEMPASSIVNEDEYGPQFA